MAAGTSLLLLVPVVALVLDGAAQVPVALVVVTIILGGEAPVPVEEVVVLLPLGEFLQMPMVQIQLLGAGDGKVQIRKLLLAGIFNEYIAFDYENLSVLLRHLAYPLRS